MPDRTLGTAKSSCDLTTWTAPADSTATFPRAWPPDGSAPLDDLGPACPAVQELAPRPGMTGMQIKDAGDVRASWTGFRCAVPAISFAARF